jgi:glycerol-3-phosphate dehydrogenase subunit C
MREGSLDAPTRHPIDWTDPDFTDPEKIDAELRRVFDICHGCRRCFNLCDSFPRLFDLIDESESGELDSVASSDFKPVVDACTLCDLCFMTKCPYVPPHEFDLDFPHLMLRYRAAEHARGEIPAAHRQLTKTDRNGKLAALSPGLVNWASDTSNRLTRPAIEAAAGVHREAALPKYHGKTFALCAKTEPIRVDTSAPAFGRKAVLYATCFVNYNNPAVGMAARAVLARNGVETEVVYPSCCGMPQLEQGDLAKVADNAKRIAAEMGPWIDKGYDVIALIAKKEGLTGGLAPLPGGVALHIACHARAQNMGQKAAEMLRLLPEADLAVIERCSGHGGSWGVLKENFEVALKVGRPVARQAAEAGKAFVASECPLAGEHIVQGMERLGIEIKPEIGHARHPIELFAQAYGIDV